MTEWIKIPEAERLTGIPDRTIRRYLGAHGHHLQVKKEHRNYLLSADSVGILTQIRDYYAAGWDSNRVEEALVASGTPMTVTVTDGHDQVTVTPAEAFIELRKAMGAALATMAEEQKRMADEVTQLRQELADVNKRLEEQNKERRQAEKERDQVTAERDQLLSKQTEKGFEELRQQISEQKLKTQEVIESTENIAVVTKEISEIKKSLDDPDRDRQLVERIRAALEEDNKKKPFWKRLFS